MTEQIHVVAEAIQLLADRCPRLASRCYWAGTSSIAAEDLGHRESFDLDFHTKKALADLRPILAEIERAFPGCFDVLQTPDEFGSGFRGVLTLPGGASIIIEALSNYEDVPSEDLVPSSIAPNIQRVKLERYLADKIQCVAERTEARDLFDIHAVLQRRPELVPAARRLVGQQDALLLAERLLAWTDDDIAEDLRPYSGVSPTDASRARDMLLQWLRLEPESKP